jgi:CBS domain-containing protein
MSVNPKHICPNVSLGEALEVMEEGDSQISILPVLDPVNSNLIGLLRLHDIFT